MQYFTYINHSEFQTWTAPDSAYHARSDWSGSHEAQSLAANGYWAPYTFNATLKCRNDKDAWCHEDWCRGVEGYVAGKENRKDVRCPGVARCKRGRQRRKPTQTSQCKSQSETLACKVAPSAPASTPKSDADAVAAAEDSTPPLLPEHLTLLAPFLSSNVDSGSWRATCQDAKEALLPNGPYTAMLSPAGQAALVALEKRKKLQKILVSAKKLVSGLHFR